MARRGSDNLERTTSQVSTASRKSGMSRTTSRKYSLAIPDSAKTLESFPSLSPDVSPGLKLGGQLVASPPRQSPTETSRKPSTKSPSIVESLIQSTPSFRGRSALFEDSPKGNAQEVPGALHHASDEHIRQLVKKTGAVALVRQLSEDVAQRDAEMTVFRRRADERERELKKMLKEVEVSNLDIETRLYRIENPTGNGFTLQDPPSKPESRRIGMGGKKERMSGVRNGIDEMMGEAMEEDVGVKAELDEGFLDSLGEADKQATLKARSVLSKESDGRSGRSTASSVDSQGRPRSTLRAWKDYLWSGNATSYRTSRASSVVSEYNDEVQAVLRARGPSGSSGRRKGLNDDLFEPPRRVSTTQSTPADQSRKSSSAVTSWTTRLFAGGNTPAVRQPEKQKTLRGRSATTGNGEDYSTEITSTASGPALSSAKAALMKVNNMDVPARQPRKNAQTPMLVPGAISKSVSQPSPQMPNSPKSVDAATNLGPVEMDTIYSPNSKPPTLAQPGSKDDISTDLLTDRFGFIYDQRQSTRVADASREHTRGKSNASANVEMIGGLRDPLKSADSDRVSQRSKRNSTHRPETPASMDDRLDEKPAKRWQDYLKVATFPTELLSHTPSAKPATKVVSEDNPNFLKRSATITDPGGSLPTTSLNLESEMSPITVGNTELSQVTLRPSSAESSSTAVGGEPVRLQLSQLTELHDTLQRERRVKWNEFLRKVRAERQKEGETSAGSDTRSKPAVMPEVTLTDGEMIGVAGLGNKGKGGRAKWKDFKQLVLAGIPVAYRAKIWAECSGASALRVPGYYEDLVSSNIDDPIIVSQIQMDINRTLTDNVFFRKGPGVAKLNEVLLAYSRRNPEVGYCQGMNLITASLLLILPTAEDAFWVLTSMIENILPQHYYDHSLLASRADQQVLRQYVTEILPKLSAHLDDLSIELEALTFQWFLSVFTDCLSAEALFRVWDVVLCFNDGSTFLFQVALALLKLNEAQLLECDTPARVYGYIGNEMTDHAISIDGLIGASEALKKVVMRSEVEERRWAAVEEEKEREKGQHRGKGAGRGTGSSGEVGDDRIDAGLSVQEPRPVSDQDDVDATAAG